MENQLVDQLLQWVVPITMFTLMFAMGLTLSKADFRRIFKSPKPVLIGLGLNLLILPVIGYLLAIGFDLSLMLAVGLVAVAATPGGTTSNMIVHMGKGDTALSITLTALATITTLITLPLWVNFVIQNLGGGVTEIEMPIMKTAVQLGLFTVLPLVLGMIAREKLPRLIKYEPLLSKLSTFAMIVAFVAAGLADSNNVLEQASVIIVPCILLLLLAVILGFFTPKLLGVNSKDCATIAVETCLKNILLSLFIATNSLQIIEVAYASAIVGMIMMPMAVLIMVAYRMSLRMQLNNQGAI